MAEHSGAICPLLRRQRYFAAVVELLPDIAEATGGRGLVGRNAFGGGDGKIVSAWLMIQVVYLTQRCREVPPTVFPAEYETWKFAVLEATAR